jgi:hypothetical protein
MSVYDFSEVMRPLLNRHLLETFYNACRINLDTLTANHDPRLVQFTEVRSSI